MALNRDVFIGVIAVSGKSIDTVVVAKNKQELLPLVWGLLGYTLGVSRYRCIRIRMPTM